MAVSNDAKLLLQSSWHHKSPIQQENIGGAGRAHNTSLSTSRPASLGVPTSVSTNAVSEAEAAEWKLELRSRTQESLSWTSSPLPESVKVALPAALSRPPVRSTVSCFSSCTRCPPDEPSSSVLRCFNGMRSLGIDTVPWICTLKGLLRERSCAKNVSNKNRQPRRETWGRNRKRRRGTKPEDAGRAREKEHDRTTGNEKKNRSMQPRLLMQYPYQ